MSIRRITIHVDPALRRDDAAALDAGCRLAAALGAKLSALIFPLSDAPGSDDSFSDAAFDAARAHVLTQAAKAGADAMVFERSSYAYGIGEILADHLKVSDLGVLPVASAMTGGRRLMTAEAIFASGCPTLLLPATTAWAGAPRRLVIGWDASRASSRALRAAVPLAVMAEETLVVVVDEAEDVRLDRSGIEATRYLALHGVRATFRQVRGVGTDALNSLEETCHAEGGDLLVLGAVRHSPLRDMILGGVTQALLAAPPELPMLVTG